MVRMHGSISTRMRIMLALTWSVLGTAAVAAPLLVSLGYHSVASVLYLLFSNLCHQMPGRSFAFLGFPFAVCHRCFGIEIGLLIGCFIRARILNPYGSARRFVALGILAALGFDALAPRIGIWTSSALSRFATGFLFGTVASHFAVHGLIEFAHDFSWRRFVSRPAQLKGELP